MTARKIRDAGFAPLLAVLILSLVATGVLVATQMQGSGYSKSDVKGALIAQQGTGDSQTGDSQSGDSNPGPQGGRDNGQGQNQNQGGNDLGGSKPMPPAAKPGGPVRQATSTEQEISQPDVQKVEVNAHDGQLEVQVHSEGATGTSSALRNENNLHLQVNSQDGQSEVQIESQNGSLHLQSQGVSARTDFPISFDKTTGQLQVTTPNGAHAIRVLPPQAAAIATGSGIISKIDNMSLGTENNIGTADTASFTVNGTKTGSLLGVIPVSFPVSTEIGAQTGNVLNTNMPFLFRLLSPLIR